MSAKQQPAVQQHKLSTEHANTWKVRRRVITSTLTFCALVILYLMLYGTDSELNRAIANGLILLSGSVIGSYIFGASWDDKKPDHQQILPR